MKSLVLVGYGVSISVDSSKLRIDDGHANYLASSKKHLLRPKQRDYDSIILSGHSGNVTLESIRWCVKQNLPVTVLDWNGSHLTTILPPESVQTKLKFAQYGLYQNSDKRLKLGREFIKAKFSSTKLVLEWLKQKYSNVNSDIEKETKQLDSTTQIPQILSVEGRVAEIYWRELSKIFDPKYEFQTRQYTNRPMGAADQINVLLNYGYGVLESRCLRAINSVGLDPHVGFVHEVTVGKLPLVYDLQEPFRWLVDVAIIKALEKHLFDKKDFIRTENYNLKLSAQGAKKLVKELEKQFNDKVSYGNDYSWDYVIFLKARELALYISGKRRQFSLKEPGPTLNRLDTSEMRAKILAVSYSEARKLGISKGGLHDLKRRARSKAEFEITGKAIRKLMQVTF